MVIHLADWVYSYFEIKWHPGNVVSRINSTSPRHFPYTTRDGVVLLTLMVESTRDGIVL